MHLTFHRQLDEFLLYQLLHAALQWSFNNPNLVEECVYVSRLQGRSQNGNVKAEFSTTRLTFSPKIMNKDHWSDVVFIILCYFLQIFNFTF